MWLDAVKHIEKQSLRDAFRLASQSALAAAICCFSMSQLQMSEKFVGVISAVLVIEPSIGNTFQKAKGRLLSSFVGAVVATTIILLLPYSFATILSLLLSMFIINSVASFKPEWRYGVVAGVALALKADGDDAFIISKERLLSIGFGALVGLVMTLVVWPDSAEKRTMNYLRKALRNTKDRFTIAFENTRDKNNKSNTNTSNNFSTNINGARNTANAITFSNKERFFNHIDNTEKLYNSILIVHRVAKKSSANVSDGDSNIEKDSENVLEQANAIIGKFADKTDVSQQEIDTFCELIQTTKKNIDTQADDKELTVLRNTFIFGLSEIKENIETLYNDFSKNG